LRLAGGLQHNRSVWRLLAISLLVPGCFYVDPVNERPIADAMRTDAGGNPKPGDTIKVKSVSVDPDGDPITLRFLVRACGPHHIICDDPLPSQETRDPEYPILVPSKRANATDKVASLTVEVVAIDEHGAVGTMLTPLVVDVGDLAPTVDVTASGAHFQGSAGYPIGLPITFIASKADQDDPLSAVTMSWTPVPPSGRAPREPVWHHVDPDPNHAEVDKYVLTPDLAGTWTVHVTADDGQGGTNTLSKVVTVDEDRPPCLGGMAPAVLDHTLPFSGDARFDVLSVLDDISAYPTPAGGPASAIKFHWSITPPEGGPLVPIATDAAGVLINSDLYTPDQLVDLRVEIEDAVARLSPCDASNPTCSIEGKPACLQRQTWHLKKEATP
jgi:hypothetical protein